MSNKTAPVQGYAPGIPWPLHLEAYEAYCKKWSPQPALIDLEGRNCRGGFTTGELDEFVPGWRDRASEIARLRASHQRLKEALAGLIGHESGTEWHAMPDGAHVRCSDCGRVTKEPVDSSHDPQCPLLAAREALRSAP